MNTRTIIKKEILRYRWLIVIGLTAILLVEWVSAYVPQLIKQAVDILAEGDTDSKRLINYGCTLAALALSIAVLRVLGRPSFLAFGRLTEKTLRKNYFSHITKLPRSFFDHTPAGDIMSRSGYDIDNIRLAVGYGFQVAFSSLMTLILAVFYMVRMSPVLCLIAMIPMVFIPFLGRRQSVKFHQCHQNIQNSFSRLTEESRSSLNTIRLIKTYDLADYKHYQFRQMSQSHLEKNMDLAKTSALYLPVMTLVTYLSQAIVLGCGGVMAVRGMLTAGEIVAFTSYLVMLRGPLIYSGYLINLYQRASNSKKRVDDIFKYPAETIEARDVNPCHNGLSPSVTIKNLTFTYPGETRPALSNISLHIPENTGHAIVGPVGSGKSTLLKLLTRVIEPPEGTVFLGGRDVTTIPLKKLRSSIGMTNQKPFVFSGSIRENLLLAAPGATEKEMWEVIDVVGLTDEIRALSGMLDGVLGEKGHNLSGGQQARLSLARTLLQKTPLLLFDDPLSAVDTRAEALILSHLSNFRKNNTKLMVSHRPLSLSFCDRIWLMDQGQMTRHGTHQALLQQSGLYQQMIKTQKISAKVGGIYNA